MALVLGLHMVKISNMPKRLRYLAVCQLSLIRQRLITYVYQNEIPYAIQDWMRFSVLPTAYYKIKSLLAKGLGLLRHPTSNKIFSPKLVECKKRGRRIVIATHFASRHNMKSDGVDVVVVLVFCLQFRRSPPLQFYNWT